MNKKERRRQAAAAARALLGLEADDGQASADNRVPQCVALPDGKPRPVDAGMRAADNPEPARPAKHANKRTPVPTGDVHERPSSERPQPSHDTAIADARAAGLLQVTDAAGTIDPKHWPKKHAPGSLKRGDSVWYRGVRHYVEFCPPTWSAGCYARICEWRVHPEPRLSASDLGKDCHAASFCVHADLLSLAPVLANAYARQPTMADAARRERSSRGEKDVGDPIAVKLREAKSLDDLYVIGASDLGIPEAELRAKYGHLNPGQQRMNIGNRMRAKWRKSQGG